MKKPTGNRLPSTGAIIREIRLTRSMRQAELAEKAGVSASYLNLIEHDRRRIGDELIKKIAEGLGVSGDDLAVNIDQVLIDRLLASAAGQLDDAEMDRVADLAIRFPGWAKLVALQSDRIFSLERRIEEASDRMRFDPTLSASLNGVIAAATSIRSTASILNAEDDLDADWQRRFQKNIYEDALRLSQNSDVLISYLEAPEEGEAPSSPKKLAEDFLARHSFHFAQIEASATTIENLLAASGLDLATQHLLRPFLDRYAVVAKELPLDAFAPVAEAEGYNPIALSRLFSKGLPEIFIRLATLPANAGHPPLGLLLADQAGVLGVSKHLAELSFPEAGACPLWPIFTSFGQPGRPVCGVVRLPGTPETFVSCFAIANQTIVDPQRAPRMQAMMLMAPGPETVSDAEPIGPACRICPRHDCDARREPSVLVRNSLETS